MAYETSTDGREQGQPPQDTPDWVLRSNAPHQCPTCGNEEASLHQWRDLELQRNFAFGLALMALAGAAAALLA